MIKLRDYQEVLISKTRDALRTNNRVILQTPTGGGKTLLACTMMKSARDRGMRSFFLVHQNELLKQTSRSLWANKLEHGMITPNRMQTPLAVQVASVMTLKNRLSRYEAPDLILIDECVTGDTEIVTTKGVKKIKDITIGDIAMCYNNGQVEFSRVSDFWCSGERDIYLVKTSCGRELKCTGNHRFKTQRGWIRADALRRSDKLYIADAAVANSCLKTNGEGSKGLFWGIKPERGQKLDPNGRLIGLKLFQKNRSVPAVAARGFAANMRKPLMNLSNTKGPEATTNIFQGTTGEKKAGTTGRLRFKSRQSTEPCLAIRQLFTRIKKVQRRELCLTTEKSKRIGLDIKRYSSTGSILKLRGEKTAGMGSLALGVCLSAMNSLKRFMTTSEQQMEKSLPRNGLIELEGSASVGGYAMMDRKAVVDLPCTQKGSAMMSRKLSPHGLGKIMGRYQSVPAEDTSIYTLAQNAWATFTRKSKNTSQNQCDISLSTVVSVKKLKKKELVYDITIPSTGNFFANGILVHNCHRALAPSYIDIVEHYPKAKVVGLTATPRRTDGRGLGHLFEDIVQGPSIRWLIDSGYLCDYELFGIPSKIDMTGVKKRGGDFDAKESFERARSREIYGDAVEHYRKFANNKLCVVMCINVEHAEEVAAYYNEQGFRAEAIHGGSKDRDGILERFQRREFTILTSVQLMIEGVDIPELEVVQWLRPTDSLIVYMQGNGRGLRKHPSKTHLIILDHVNNYQRHGMPCAHRDWDLADSKRNSRTQVSDEELLSIQTCEHCYFTFRTGVPVCPSCGREVELRKTKTEIIDAELQRIEQQQLIENQRREKRREQGRSQSIVDLIELGVRNEYKNPWAWATNVFFSRMNKKPTRQDYQDARRIYFEIQNGTQHSSSSAAGVI